MKLRHALALTGLLIGCASVDSPKYYLMTAPAVPGKGPDVKAPISTWTRIKTFDRIDDCMAERLPGTKLVSNPATRTIEIPGGTTKCVASDDPIPKPNQATRPPQTGHFA